MAGERDLRCVVFLRDLGCLRCCWIAVEGLEGHHRRFPAAFALRAYAVEVQGQLSTFSLLILCP